MTIDTPTASAPTADRLAGSHVAQVAHLVREVMGRAPAGAARDDLHAAGLLALLATADEGDVSTAELADRAALRVRGALVDELRSVNWAVRAACPRDPASARDRLDAVLARFPDPAAAAAVLDQASGPVAPPAPPRTAPTHPRARSARREEVAAALEALPERLRRVARGYFLDGIPMAALAADVGGSEDDVAQLRDEALVLLRDAVASAPERASGGLERHRHATTRALALQHVARQTVSAPNARTTA